MTLLALQWRAGKRALNLRWCGPDSETLAARQARQMPALAAIIGIGATGPAGDAVAASLVAAVNVRRGQPLAIDRATRQLVLADATHYPRAFVVGLAAHDCDAGFVVDVIGAGPIALADWSSVAGAALVPGLPYFLAEGGGITATRPTTIGASSVVVGEAITAEILNIRCQPPILL